jgi:preprotein translocase subunit SecB
VQLSETQRHAARLASKAKLLDVRATRLHADLVSIPESKELEFEVSLDSGYSDMGEDGRCVYSLQTSVTGREGEQNRFEAAVVIVGLYVLPTDASDDELRAFGEVTAALALYPYVRATVQDLAARLGIPDVTLPMYQVALTLEDGESPPQVDET